MSFEDFSTMMKKISDEDRARADNAKFNVEDKGYKIIPIMSYEELHEKFGGDATGYDGESEWCHTNGQSTYDSWTENYTKFFFVIAKDNWENIEPHDNPRKDDNAYDEYGLSLMAILASRKGNLLKCTLRWNHIVEPKYAKPGREVDRAFISYAELSQVTSLDVEAEVKKDLAKILERFKTIPKGQKVYEGPEGICFASDHLYWYDKDFNEIDPPQKIKGSIILFSNDNVSITSLEGSPRVVDGDFNCSQTDITSLKGCPEEVGGSFGCSYIDITSLEGCPKKVGGYFYCQYTKITSLKGSPRVVGKTFYCADTEITSLEGCPREVGKNFNCSNTKITSLEGAPKSVCGNFDCSYTSITSLEGCPEIIRGAFYCNDTKITSLEGSPEKVGGSFYCADTKITSLKGGPKTVIGYFNCSNTKITSLEGGPKTVIGYFNCSNTSITSLKGSPRVVGGYFDCSDTSITSLEGSPKTINGYFNCPYTKITSLKGAPAKIGNIKYSDFPDSMPAQQLDAYKKWLKTNPTENYPG